MKTDEHLFCGVRSEMRETALLTVRPGMPAAAALEQAALNCHTVAGALREISERQEGENASGLYYALASSLETADALIQSVISPAMRAEEPKGE